ADRPDLLSLPSARTVTATTRTRMRPIDLCGGKTAAYARRARAGSRHFAFTLLAIFLAATPAGAHGVARLAADLATDGPDFGVGADHTGRLGSEVLFAGLDSVHGQELW